MLAWKRPRLPSLPFFSQAVNWNQASPVRIFGMGSAVSEYDETAAQVPRARALAPSPTRVGSSVSAVRDVSLRSSSTSSKNTQSLVLGLTFRGVFFAVAIFLATVGAFAQESHIGNLTGHASQGKQIYRRYCVGCHGPDGDGEGENAPYLDPKPRDFTAGTFKCRSTPTGSIPLDEDLFRTIGRGVDTTAMPSWLPLTKQQRADLVAYIKTFSPRFKEEKPDKPVAIPPETPSTPDSIKRGDVIYHETLKCVQCHGETGKGDGPSAFSLRDNKDNPIKPYDFHDGTRFKCGESDADIYRVFMTGLDGTPMPSFIDFVKPDQGWDLVHYVRSLQINYKPKSRTSSEEQAKAK
jgi:mono/diheme cytochrome c family protein